MLSEIRQEVIAAALATELLETFYDLDVTARPLDQRVVVAIIGLATSNADNELTSVDSNVLGQVSQQLEREDGNFKPR
jgi:hypothetical protein